MTHKTIIEDCTGFQWDAANINKNWLKHHVGCNECEQVFFNEPLLILKGAARDGSETRWYALGKTDFLRYLFVVFTIRKGLIRIISARDMSKKEKKIYHEQT
jgi:uncharacterized protein